MIKYQATTTERSQICVSQQYLWHMMIEVEWEDLRRKNSPYNIFTRFSHNFQLNLDETSFLYNEGDLKVIGRKYKPRHDKNFSDSRFSITVLQVGSAAGVNGPKKVHPRIRGTNLVTRYGLPEVSCLIPKKASYMDDDIWAKVLKVVDPGIRKMKVSNVDCGFPILLSIYLTLHLCTYKFSSYDMYFPKVVVIPHI